MGSMTIRYSHAAPYIRHLACHAVSRAIHSDTQRDRRLGFAEADGMMTALDVLLCSPEGADDPGTIADEETIPTDAIIALVQRWGKSRGERPVLLPIVATPIPVG